MTRKIFLLLTLVFIFSCSNRPDNHNKNVLVDSPNVSNDKNQIDSLDLDTTNYITSNFPDTVRSILYGTSESLIDFIKKSSILRYKIQNVLFSDSLSKILSQNGFQIDNSQREIIATKKLFNKRETISWGRSKSDTITTQVIYWHLGKKYILIWQRWHE